MTATVTTPTTDQQVTEHPTVWKAGVKAGLVAAAATVGIVALARIADVPVESAPGESIPLLGFAQMTLLCTALGVLIARVVGRRAARPRSLFTKVAVTLTALSLLPDLALSTGTADKLTLIATHLVAAAIVIPALAGRLPERS